MRIFFLIFTFFLVGNLLCQNYFCKTTEVQNEWFSKHPELKIEFDKLQEQAQLEGLNKTNALYQNQTTSASVYTVPVVFHILHTGGIENISDAQVIDALNILTRDFNKLNPDTANVVLPFKTLIGNTNFKFQLATKDPNGNCTNGIVRHWDTKTNWIGNFPDYIYTWNPNRYLNIYVVKSIGSGAAGYTYLPGSGIPSAVDAILILSTYVGSIGTGNVGTSRALTHEVGHWFNLPHVWGGTNQPGVACGDDGVADTPITKGYSNCTLNNSAICTPGIAENIQNYMEYAYCQNMFTIGQSSRMQNSLNSPISGRNVLSSISNLSITGITNPSNNCIPDISINALPSFTVCSGRLLTFFSYTSNASPTNYSWSANNNALVLNSTAATTSINFNTIGNTTVTCVASNLFGSSSKSIVINVVNGNTQINNSNSESFENVTLPMFWSILNPTTPNQKWDIYSGAGSMGSKCMFVNGEQLIPNSIEILESPSYDFKNNQGAFFSFKYAYARASSENKDLFKVQGSKNCGGTWEDIWVPSNYNLANSSGGTTSNLFVPFPYEWAYYNLSSHPNFINYINDDHVTFRFYFQEDIGGSGFGNRIYLDEINFTIPNGVNELTKSLGFNVFPNPTKASFNLSFNLSNTAKIKYQITTITGAIIMQEEEKIIEEGFHEIHLNENNKLNNGIYFINFEMNGIKMSKKLIIN